MNCGRIWCIRSTSAAKYDWPRMEAVHSGKMTTEYMTGIVYGTD